MTHSHKIQGNKPIIYQCYLVFCALSMPIGLTVPTGLVHWVGHVTLYLVRYLCPLGQDTGLSMPIGLQGKAYIFTQSRGREGPAPCGYGYGGLTNNLM